MINNPFILLLFSALTLSMVSCNKTKNNKTAAADTDNHVQKQRTDSVLHSIQGKTKTFVIDAATKNNLVSKNGIKISIPAHAFVTSGGEMPTGKVSVTIEEYHNSADILVSGIPMQYKTKNGPVQMESAGMFNIEASAQGKPLQLAQGKEIGMQVPSKNKDADFNLYYFDPEQNEWTQTQEQLPIAEMQTEKDIATETVSETKMVDASSVMTIEWAAADNMQRVIDGKKIYMVRPVCLYDDQFFTFPVVINKYPELSLFKESVWTGYTKQDKLKVDAAFDIDQLLTAEIIERELPLNKYLIRFEFRNIKFDAYMSIASKSETCDINDEIYFACYDERPVDEKKIEQIKTKAKIAQKEDEIYRSFSINKLGVWNCDRLYLLTKKTMINPLFRNRSNNELYTPATTYLIDKKINSVWTFYNTVTLNPESDNILIFVNEKGRMCYAQVNTIPQAPAGTTIEVLFDVTELEDHPGNTDELNVLLKGV